MAMQKRSSGGLFSGISLSPLPSRKELPFSGNPYVVFLWILSSGPGPGEPSPGAKGLPQQPSGKSSRMAGGGGRAALFGWGCCGTGPPFTMEAGGQVRGFAWAYLESLASLMGLSLEPVPEDSWKELVRSIQEREVDLIPGIWKVPEREKVLFFHSFLFREPHSSGLLPGSRPRRPFRFANPPGGDSRIRHHQGSRNPLLFGCPSVCIFASGGSEGHLPGRGLGVSGSAGGAGVSFAALFFSRSLLSDISKTFPQPPWGSSTWLSGRIGPSLGPSLTGPCRPYPKRIVIIFFLGNSAFLWRYVLLPLPLPPKRPVGSRNTGLSKFFP